MSLVFRASTNVFLVTTIIWNFLSKVLKIYHQVFFNSENLLSSNDQCTRSFIQTFKTRWQVIMVLLLHMREMTWKRTVYIFSFYLFFLIIIFVIIIMIYYYYYYYYHYYYIVKIFHFIFEIGNILVYNMITDL